jgi:hypothetical protein
VNTHTFGPKVAVSASGHRLEAELGAELTAVAGDEPTTAALAAGTAASTPATSAAARISGLAITRITAPHCARNRKYQQDCNPWGIGRH